MSPLDNPASRAADLLDAARSGELLSDLPSTCRPRDDADAYAVQDELIHRRGPPAGWKVAPGQTPRCSPIFSVLADGQTVSDEMRQPLAEVEIGLLLDRDLRADPGDDELAAAIAGVVPSLEILSSRFVDRTSVSRATSLADLQSNGCAVVGRLHRDWCGLDFSAAEPVLRIDAEPSGTRKALATTEEVLQALRWLAGHVAERGQPLRRGQIVLTGARLGPVPVRRGATVEGGFAPFGTVRAAMPLNCQ